MRVRINYAAVLDLFLSGLETLSRRDCGLILAGLRVCPGDRQAAQWLVRLERQGLIDRHGRGQHARFSITPEGAKRVKVLDPARAWNRPWDGKWRAFSYDLPETRKKDRAMLWRALRVRKLGLLQRSMWVWPHDVEPMLLEIVNAQGIPECFCGMESSRLLLCTNAEVVVAAWDFEEIGRRHETYLKHLSADPASWRAGRDLKSLARVVALEREAYQFAFALDPLLPRVLWTKSYKGHAVQARHEQFRAVLRHRLYDLTRET